MSKYIIDANVPLIAGTSVKDIPQDQLQCARKCLDFIRKFMNNPQSGLVLDAEGRVLREYRKAFEGKGEPNAATEFCIWAHQMPKDVQDYIHLTEIAENEFQDYPKSDILAAFDPPDRKYIALAHVHPEKPPIVEASDSKWWGIKDELKKNGIEVLFIDEDYIKEKYMQKISV